MSKVIYTEELKKRILSEHEAGISVRELSRRRRHRKEWWNRAYQLIEVESKNFTIRLMCRVLEISESSYYRWSQRQRQPSPRARANEQLLVSIRGIMVDSKWTYYHLSSSACR